MTQHDSHLDAILGHVGVEPTAHDFFGVHAPQKKRGPKEIVASPLDLRTEDAATRDGESIPSIRVTEGGARGSVINTIPAATAAAAVLAYENQWRKGLYVYNGGTGNLYLALSKQNASTTYYTIKIAAGGYYELPASPELYCGQVTGIWDATGGSAMVTEIS